MVVPIVVREVMHAPVETVSPGASLVELASRLRETGEDTLVVARDGEPLGVVTRTDVLDRVATGAPLTEGGADAESVMSSPPVSVAESTPIRMGAATLYEHDVDQVLVTEGDAVVGLLRTVDLAPYLPPCVVSRTVEPHMAPLEAEEREWEYEVEDRAAPGVSVGDVVRFSKPISERDLELFAEVSGDKNRLHLDETFAERTRFKRRIVHGALASSVISAALSKLPGLVIYLSQNVTYSAPVEIGERVTARCEVIADLGGDRYRLSVEERDETDTEVISGEATVLVDPLPDAGSDA